MRSTFLALAILLMVLARAQPLQRDLLLKNGQLEDAVNICFTFQVFYELMRYFFTIEGCASGTT
jgi:hypothetical protein